jgi:hypothetical protein
MRAPLAVPTISPGEMQLLLSRAGLVLNPGQIADLVLAWRQVAGLIASIPHDRPLADDMALAFRLPAPAGTPAAPAPPAARPATPSRPKAKAKARAKPPVKKAKAKAAPKRRAVRPAPRKSARRKR